MNVNSYRGRTREDVPAMERSKGPGDLPRTRQSKLHPDFRSDTPPKKRLHSCRAGTTFHAQRSQIPSRLSLACHPDCGATVDAFPNGRYTNTGGNDV